MAKKKKKIKIELLPLETFIYVAELFLLPKPPSSQRCLMDRYLSTHLPIVRLIVRRTAISLRVVLR